MITQLLEMISLSVHEAIAVPISIQLHGLPVESGPWIFRGLRLLPSPPLAYVRLDLSRTLYVSLCVLLESGRDDESNILRYRTLSMAMKMKLIDLNCPRALTGLC